MALNEIYNIASQLTFRVAPTVVSGDLVTVGTLVGVALEDATTGEDGFTYTTLKLDGAFKLATTVNNIARGANVFVTAAGLVNVTAASNKFIGHAITSGVGFVVVRLVQTAAVAAA